MTNFSTQVVEEIESRGLTPKPRWHFLLKRSVFWSLALLSIAIGAVAFAVGDFVFFDNEGIKTAVLLESPLEGILQSIPFVWLFVFSLFTASEFLGLRHTKSGYRYQAVVALAGVIMVSVGAGLLLNILDFGEGIHTYLLEHTIFYDPLINSSEDVGG